MTKIKRRFGPMPDEVPVVGQGTPALGVSTFDVDDLEEARALLRKHPIACNQVLYHLGERHIDADLVPYCAKHDIAVVGYSPFGHGRFPSSSRAGGKALAAVAARHQATPRQVALACLARESPLFTIPKHRESNMPRRTRAR